MAVAASELNSYKAQGADSGRRDLSNKITSVVGDLVPRISEAEQAAGYDRDYKIFLAVDNDQDETFFGAYLILDTVTPGDDWATLYAGTPRDSAADHPSPRRYGTGLLVSDYSGGTTLTIDMEDSSITGAFADGDTVFILDDATDPTSVNKRTISGVPSVSGTEVTITLDSAFDGSFTTANNARLASAISLGDLECSYDSFATSGSGGYDDTTFPLLLDNLGTIEQDWAIEFTDVTSFTCTGDVVGTLAVGSTGSDYAPVNPVTGKPYFTLRAGGHSGTHAALDAITFTTHGPEVAAYVNLVGPAGGTVVPGNFTLLVLGGS